MDESMKAKNLMLLVAFIVFTTVLDALATEARRIRFIIRMYGKGKELNDITDLMRAIDDKRREEMNEFVDGWRFIRNAVNGKR